METEQPQAIDRAIEAILQLQPTMHRKMHREVFSAGLRQLGSDIAAHHLIIMKKLQECGRATSSEIGEVTYISKAQMTHSTGKLIRMGLIEKHPDTRDKRKTNLQLTPTGRDTLEHMHQTIVDLLRLRLSALPADELEKLARSLEDASAVLMKLK